MLDGRYGVVEFFSIDALQFAAFKAELDLTGAGLGDGSGPGVFGQIIPGGERFLSTYGGTPKAFVDAILRLFNVHLDAVVLEEVYLFLAAKPQVADGGDDL